MREAAKSFQDLIVWQKAHQAVLDAYQFSQCIPKIEQYGLTSQFRRSVISVAAYIAEGFKKKGRADKVRFLNVAQGSLEETRYYLILIQDLEYAETSKLMIQIEEISKLLEVYTKAILNSAS